MSNIQKSWFFPTAPPTFAPFCRFWGQIVIFSQKWNIILKHLIVFYLHAKQYKKWLNGSKDSNLTIKHAIFEILPNFAPIFRGEGVEIEKKWSISIRKYISRAIQIWNQIFKIFSSCVGYLPIFGPFFHFSGKWEFFWKMVFGTIYTL